MHSQRAKFILHSYRGAADAADPQFAQALQHLERDPETAEWFADEQAWDDAIRRKLKEVVPPADLCRSIIDDSAAEVPRVPQPRYGILSLAAVLLLLASLAA